MTDQPAPDWLPYGYVTFQALPERIQVAQWSALWEVVAEIRDYQKAHPEHVSLGTHRALNHLNDAFVSEAQWRLADD